MLTKQKHSPYWYEVLYNGVNCRKWVSTMIKSKTEAKIFNDELYAMLKKACIENKKRELLELETNNQEPFSTISGCLQSDDGCALRGLA